jgi:hypothetical protein
LFPEDGEEESGDRRKVSDAYQRCFLAKRGIKPTFGKRGGKAITDLLAVMSADEAVATIENAFKDSWFAEHCGGLWEISNRPDAYRKAPEPEPEVYKPRFLAKAAPPSPERQAEIDARLRDLFAAKVVS